MKTLQSIFKLSYLYVKGKTIDVMDISNTYTKVSCNYNNSFLDEMHKYNEEMLDVLIASYKNNNKDIEVLDLACGTGFNSRYIYERLSCKEFTLVDVSNGMLNQAKKLNKFNCNYIEKDMLSFLKSCNDNSFDIVVCAWAIKYQNPHKIIKELKRVVKKNGFLSVIVNLKGTLPEVRKIYPWLVREHIEDVNKIMLELPNPISKVTFNGWFTRKGFKKHHLESGEHKFNFEDTNKLINWVTSTGALAGFDTMVNMEDIEVKNTMIKLFNKHNIKSITHKFVWGIYINEK